MLAKACIGYTGLESAPGTAIIGSTNFSAAGFTGNTDLNYPVTHGGDICHREYPPLDNVGNAHYASCRLLHPEWNEARR